MEEYTYCFPRARWLDALQNVNLMRKRGYHSATEPDVIQFQKFEMLFKKKLDVHFDDQRLYPVEFNENAGRAVESSCIT